MNTPHTPHDDALSPGLPEESAIPSNINRRSFIMRNAVIGAAAVMTGRVWTPEARAQQAAKEAAAKSPLPPLDSTSMSSDLDVVKRSKGPVMTILEEFYKVGPGPSSSHTIGPMRITYDFYQRCSKLPADQLAQATGLKVHLYGSLSATGKGHGTERAALAGLLGKEPATVDPLFLDAMKDKPDQSYPLKLGDKKFNLSLADIIYDSPKGDFPHPNTMTCKLLGEGDKAVYELEYYSPGGGFYEWKGYTPPKKGQPKYPYATMKELRQHAEKNNLSIAQVIMANEVAVSGKTEAQINAFLDKISGAMLATVKAGLAVKEGVLPGPIKLQSKAATVWERAQDDKFEADRAVALLSACALAASEENARGHLVITAPTGGSAGVMPAIVYALETKRKLPKEKIRQGLLGGAAIGYLCKHNATLSGAEGGCQSEIGVASAMSAAFIASAMGAPPLVTENAAESALEHHLGMTCDPVAGYVQVPCIERCAFGAVKAWTAYMIATNEIASRHRVDLDTTIETLAETGKDMSTKYKETSEAGLAANLVLC